MRILIFFIYNLFWIEAAYAYVGPGMSGGLIAATLGIVVAIFAAIIGILWFPLKRFFMKRKQKKKNEKK